MNDQYKQLKIIEADIDAAAFIESELLKSLREELTQSLNDGFVLAAKDEAGSTIGGLIASTSYGWALIKVLWVNKAARQRGLGRSLMERAEQKARELGCHAAWLDTSNPKAMKFYLKLGYEVFGELANSEGQFPSEHQRWFMRKHF